MFASNNLLPDIYVPTFEIIVNNKALDPKVAKSVLEVSVTEHLNPPAEFNFQVNDPKLVLIDPQNGVFKEGDRLEISIGYVGHMSRMIVGEIATLTADFPSTGPATVEVTGYDLLHRFTRGTAGRPFGDGTPANSIADSDIVFTLAKEMKLNPAVDTTSPRDMPRVQNNVTNLDFLEQLAEANGCTLWVEGTTLHFAQQAPAPNTVELEWGKTLMSFSPRLSTAGQVNVVGVRGRDPKQKQEIWGQAPNSVAATNTATNTLATSGAQQVALGSGGQSTLVIEDARVSSDQEANKLAEKILSELQQGLITGNGTSVGHPGIHVGTILNLKGIFRFEGSYAVKQAAHSVGSSGYQTSFQVTKQL